MLETLKETESTDDTICLGGGGDSGFSSGWDLLAKEQEIMRTPTEML